MTANKSTLIAVVGPTASGKTRLALELARRLGGEIVSTDSRQVYRRLQAGTDKPAGAWLDDGAGGRAYRVEGVAYHLVDILDPTEEFSAGDFLRLARPCIAGVRARGAAPILAGGTGMYLKALFGGLDPLPGRDPAVRARLAEEAAAGGRAALHARLSRLDPQAAAGIPANNLQRVMRALEVIELTGKAISSSWSAKKEDAGEPALLVGIEWDRAALAGRIARRCQKSFPAMVEEARRLLADGVAEDAPGLRTLGYPEAVARLKGIMSDEEAVSRYTGAVVRYAKRQRTWFRNQHEVRWIAADGREEPGRWADTVETWLRE